MDPNSSVVFIMNHRSNMDYILLAYLPITGGKYKAFFRIKLRKDKEESDNPVQKKEDGENYYSSMKDFQIAGEGRAPFRDYDIPQIQHKLEKNVDECDKPQPVEGKTQSNFPVSGSNQGPC